MNQKVNEAISTCSDHKTIEYKIPLTPFQEIFYYEWLHNPLRDDYNIVMDSTVTGELSFQKSDEGFIKLINEHFAFRSNIRNDEGGFYWIPREDISELTTFHDHPLTDEEIYKIVSAPFDLEKDLLVRKHIIKLEDKKYRIVIVIAHLIIDGIKTQEIYEKWTLNYNSRGYNLPSLQEQIVKHQELHAYFENILNKNKQRIHDFWSKHLDGITGVDFSFLKSNAVKVKSQHRFVSEYIFSYDEATINKVKSLRHNYKITPYIFGQLVLAILLHKISGQKNIGLTYPIALLEGKELMYAAHINSIIIDYRFNNDTTPDSLIEYALCFFKDLKTTKAKYLPIHEIVQYADNAGVLDIGFAQTFLRDNALNFEGIELEKINHEFQIDLVNKLLFEQEQHENKINYRVKYDKEILDEKLVGDFVIMYQKLFNELLEDLLNEHGDKKISSYQLLEEYQYTTIVSDWNQTQCAYPSDKTIIQLFELQVERTPDNIAVVFENISFTYRQLNAEANKLGLFLKKQYDIQPDDLITLCMDRSQYMMIAILGVLKSGAAYVPLSPEYPDERISYAIEDTRTKIMLTNLIYKERIGEICGEVSVLAIEENLLWNEYPTANFATALSPDNLAYVIYTSGTTGKPKGVLIEHKSVANLVFYQKEALQLGDKSAKNCLWYSNYVFDAHVWEVYVNLLFGHQLFILPERLRLDINSLEQYISDNSIFLATLPPVLLDRSTVLKLNTIIVAGEVTGLEVMNNYCHHGVRVVNAYGPTETTVCATVHTFEKGDSNKNIGKPISNTTTYVLDEQLNPVPVGVIGELYIGGDGVARGYLNKPEMTAEKFLPNPFRSEQQKVSGCNSRIYKTGDLVRYLSNGAIEYVGRNDFQVKIRGFRIELGEIESRISSYKGVENVLVLARQEENSSNKYLVAYYLSGNKIDEVLLKEHLSEVLPDYMLPSFYIHLTEFPLTVNGKIDRRALPKPQLTDALSYVAPANHLEKKLSQIYGELLGLDHSTISVEDDFYKLGGNSIMAIKLVTKINKELEKNIFVSAIFTYRTIRKLAGQISQGEENTVQITKTIVNNPEEQLLSFAQERLWFIESYEGGSNAYNIPMTFEIAKDVNINSLQDAICMIVYRHEILRSLIKTNADGLGYQDIIDDKEQPLVFEKQVVTSVMELDNAIAESAARVFNLESEYPIYVKHYKMEAHNYMSIVIHHIAFDGWSTDLFINEIWHYYNYCQTFKNEVAYRTISEPLPDIDIQYKDFALWQRKYLQGNILATQLKYWKNQLDGYETLNLPTDTPRPSHISYSGNDVSFQLNQETSFRLKEVAKELNVSMYSLLLSGYYLLLSAYSNQQDIVVGTPISGRHYREISDTIGFFVNTLALRQQIDPGQSVSDLVKKVGHAINEAQKNQDLPFEKLVEELNIDKDTSRHPVFQAVFDLQSFGKDQLTTVSELFQIYQGNNRTGFQIAKFDLTAVLDDSGDCICGTFNYATSLFSEETINNFMVTYTRILDQLATLKTIDLKIGEINYLDKSQFTKIISDWNQTQRPYAADSTINQLFEAQAEKFPDNIAVVYKDTKLTYKALNERANYLANYLIANYHITPGDHIALCLNRSEHMLVAIMGVLKAGAAYIPIDPTMPHDRIAYMISDAVPKALLADEANRGHFEILFPDADIIDDPLFCQEIQSAYPATNPQRSATPDDLAYVIYTSGTTGDPKGVMVEHKSVNRLIINTNFVSLDENDITLSLSGYQFDGSIYDFFAPLLNGATLVLSTKEIFLDLNELNALIEKSNITNFFITTTLFNSVVDADLSSLKKLRYVILGGEKASLHHVCKFKENYPSVNLVNGYGPTETTTFATSYLIDASINNELNSVLIGYPIANTTAYVLDKYLQPLPAGAIGELYIGGPGVARGYLNNPDLTAERFLENPFQNQQEQAMCCNDRIYKTGDLVRYLADGSIEYIGRNDFQVKIRGFRIELGEIEAALIGYPEIRQTIVLAKDHVSGNKYLVGYYMAEKELDNADIRSYLEKTLPDFMLPSVLMYVAEFPLTVNGKLDHRALPTPEFTDKLSYTAPENETEDKLCQIYGEVLGLDPSDVGTEDDFFKLGGDSISSIQLVNRIRQQLNNHIGIRDIFNYRTIKSLSHIIITAESTKQKIETEQGLLTGNVSLLPVQEWFFDNVNKGLLPSYNHFNQSFIIKTPQLDKTLFELSVRKLIEYHDSFRLTFNMVSENSFSQYYQEQITHDYLDFADISKRSSKEPEDIMSDWQTNFDITKGRLFHIGYLDGYEDETARIHFALHHLIVDAVSWRIIKNDLETIYKYLFNHKDESVTTIPVQTILGNKGSSYRQWTDAMHHYKQSHPSELNEEKAYWKSIISDVANTNAMFVALKRKQQNRTELLLDKTRTKLLLQKVNDVYGTQINDILLTALSKALTTLTGNRYHHVLLEGHGRENIFPEMDINNTTGWFTDMYPVKLDSKGNNPGYVLSATKNMLRQIPDNGIGYGSLIGYTGNELPCVSFNYLGQFDIADNADKNQWSFSRENSGVFISKDNKDQYVLNMNGGIIEGELQFFIVSMLQPEELKNFAGSFKEHLEALIDCLANENRKYLTCSDTNFTIQQSYLDRIQKTEEIEGIYHVNSLQEGFIYHAINQGEIDDAYRVQVVWDYHNQLDCDCLKKAWEHAQQKYEALRLRFAWDEELVQIIDKKGRFDWDYKDISSQNDAEKKDTIKKLVDGDRLLSFDLQQGSLFRVYLVKQGEHHYTCLFSSHHSILDGWSSMVLVNYIHETYIKLINKEQTNITPDTDYGLVQKFLQQHRYENLDFWKKEVGLLESQEDLSSLLKPEIRSSVVLAGYRHIKEPKEKQIIIYGNDLLEIKALCNKYGFTVNALLQYCWHRQLSIYSASRTTVVGTVVSGRNLPIDGIEQSVGLYINTLPVIHEHNEQPVLEQIKQIQHKINEVNSRSDVSLASLQRNGERLFNTLFVFENYPIPKSEETDKVLNIEFVEGREKLDYPLGAIVFEKSQEQELLFSIKYASELFDELTIDQILEGISFSVKEILYKPDTGVQQLKYLGTDQYKQIVSSWNQTRCPYSSDKTITHLFEAQVEKFPDNTAVIYNDIKLTYKELNASANHLASYLVDTYHACPGDMIALCMNRSEHMLVTILGVLKTGAAYVPIDPTMPDERIAFMISDSGAKAVLTDQENTVRMQSLFASVNTVNSPSYMQEIHSGYPSENLRTNTKADDLAYVIYTSGTTGNPKGVMVEHKSVNRLIVNTNYVTLDETDSTLSLSGYQFDGSIYDFFAPLLNGATLVLSTKEIFLDLNELNALIQKNNITNFFITTALFNSIVDAELSSLSSLKYVLFGGEKVSVRHVCAFREMYPAVNLVHVYGPTETTTFATSFLTDESINDTTYTVPIGYPIANTTAYVLDKNLQPLPSGAIGELYIGGAGVARGYLNNPELTAERFLVNPFQDQQEQAEGYNGHIYKTGDLVRYLSDGSIEYVGRNDFQVKIRGFRIELGEIQAALNTYPGIKQSVVLAKEHVSGSKYLVGYYMSDKELDEIELRNSLGKSLPDFMVPSVLIHLEAFPLTVNGKINQRALPEPEFTDKQTYVAPENDTEAALCRIYGEVLGIEPSEISVEDDFYRLGGNSIMAIKLLTKINKALEKNIHVSAIFTYKTIRGLSGYMTQGEEDTITISKTIITTPEEQLLSFAQERLWFIESYEGGSNAYNVPMVFELGKTADIDSIQEAICMVVHRHEVLRSLIKTNAEGTGYQVVIDDRDEPLVFEKQLVTSTEELDKAIAETAGRIFHLETEYPIHVKRYMLEDRNFMSITIHHIAFDGWSTELFIKEIQYYYDYYQKLKTGEDKGQLPEIAIQYKDFALWQRTFLQGSVSDNQLNYWKQQLDGYETLNLPTDKLRPAQVDYSGNDLEFRLDKQTSSQLKEVARELNVSMYSLLLSGYYLLLSAYSNQTDIVVGSPISGRHYREITDTIGFFVNTLALRQQLNAKQSVSDFIQEVGNTINEAQKYQDLPFEKLVGELLVGKDTSRHPVFQVMFGVQSFGNDQASELSELFEIYQGSNTANFNVAKFDLTTMLDDSGDCICGTFNYATSLFTESTIHSYIATYTQILNQLAKLKMHDFVIDEISYLDKAVSGKIVSSWNQTRCPYASDKTITHLFEAQVEKHPDNTAVIYNDIKLTYKELNASANQLASYLIDTYHACPGDMIALCMNRSEYMLVSILGVLKTGAAYVPIDPTMPDERIAFMISDSCAKAVLTDQENTVRMQSLFASVNTINATFIQEIRSKYPSDNPQTNTKPNDLAYVIYTSGTTGNPKGVMVEHKSVNRLIVNTNYVALDETDSTLSLSGYQFDGSIYDFFAPLLNGATLVLSTKEIFLDLNELNALIKKNNVTNFFITTALFNSIVDAELSSLGSLKYVLFGGEKVSVRHVCAFREKYPAVNLVHVYGPTETTTFATSFLTDPSINDTTYTVPIGYPIANTTAYVLDKHLQPLPSGAIGELYIGGAGVARGYLNNPELTAERFLVNPFQNQQEQAEGYNGHIYKTGDLVRYLSDGSIEYVGRNDFQVKIRGFRIELGEIQAALNTYPGIKQSVVLAKEHVSGSKYLVGYYMSDKELDEIELRNSLGKSLPDFMVPSILIHLEAFPLTVNGKINQRALPEPEFTDKQTYIAPANDTEESLCRIYGEVLGIEPSEISVEDDFYRLGGNSIMAIKLLTKINKALEKNIHVSAIFTYKTIRGLSGYMTQGEEDTITISKTIITTPEEQLLSFAQERLWFIESYEGGSNAYNVPMVFELGKTADIDSIQEAICMVVHRHEVLRSLIKTNAEGTGYQIVIDDRDEPLVFEKQLVTSTEELDKAIAETAGRIFHLETEYPIHVKHYMLEDRNFMSITIHHIAFDGWSTELFIKEIQYYYDYYQRLKTGEDKGLLPEIAIQYKDFALWQRDFLQGDVSDNQLSYWKKQLDGYETLNLPKDKLRPAHVNYSGNDLEFRLDKQTSSQLKEIARELNVSMYSLLLSGYYLLLSAYSNQTDIVVGTPISGRHYREISDTIGFFVNTLALRQQLNSRQSVSDFIREVGNTINEAQKYQDLPFEKLVGELFVEKDTSRHPVFQVMFGVQSFGNDQASELSELFEIYQGSNTANFNVAKFDLTTMLDDSGDCICGTFNYATSLFEESTIQSYISTYTQILNQLAGLLVQDFVIGEITYLDKAEFDKVVIEWNQTQKPYSSDKTINQLFEAQVEKTPDNIAVCYEDVRLTYRQLNERANNLANYLITSYGIWPDDLIALCLNRSEHILIAILGVLKTGGAYVPMDPQAPDERIAFMVNDTKAKVVLTNQVHQERINRIINDLSVPVIEIDSYNFQHEVQAFSDKKIQNHTSNSNLAYVIYTSGTTGKPKGVMVEHKNVNNTIKDLRSIYDFKTGSPVTAYTSYTFDVSVSEFLVPVLGGAELHIISEARRTDVDALSEYLLANKIEYAYLPPVILSNLPRLSYPALKTIIYAGEPCDRVTGEYWSERKRLYNYYGPTEATIYATGKQIINGDTHLIGRPVSNVTAYVLNKDMQPLPVGAIGELYIGGTNVGRGYLNDPELTVDRFLNNPFQCMQEKELGYNGRIYKTGDLVKYQPDGNIEYVGRNDFQVKIRGFRIELAEIEKCLLSYPAIKQAVVIAKEHVSGTKFLVGYYVSDAELDHNHIHTFLDKSLPEYMIPPVFVHLTNLPLTSNGKLNRKALPEPEFTDNQTYIAPANETEKQLCQVYGAVLGIDPSAISTKDDFYKLGGNSILAIRLVHKVNNLLNTKIRIVDILESGSIQNLSSIVRQNKAYQPVVTLNDSNHESMFMVHPGIGGCDVYLSLANKLTPYYHCYGVDSYNLYHSEKIKDLGQLADYYLNAMEQTQGKSSSYSLLGWSLGGQIALEIAAKLESRGVKDITVFLLDTWMAQIQDERSEADINNFMAKFNIPEAERENILKVMEVDDILFEQPISQKLHETKVVLFKAMEGGVDVKYQLQYPYNHIDSCLNSISQLKLIEVPADHHSIVDQEQILIQEIRKSTKY